MKTKVEGTKKGVNSSCFALGNVSAKSGGDTTSSYSLDRSTIPRSSSIVNKPKHFSFGA